MLLSLANLMVLAGDYLLIRTELVWGWHNQYWDYFNHISISAPSSQLLITRGQYILSNFLYFIQFLTQKANPKIWAKKYQKSIFFCQKPEVKYSKIVFFPADSFFSQNPQTKMEVYPPLLWSGGILSVSWRDMNMTEQGHWTKHRLGLLMQRGWNHGITKLNVIQTPEYI